MMLDLDTRKLEVWNSKHISTKARQLINVKDLIWGTNAHGYTM